MMRKVLSIVLSFALVLGSMGMAFGETTEGSAFADMPDNWSTAALNKAVENKLLSGYEEDGVKLIKADNPLTRAEMAAIVNRAFASVATADISKVSDVDATAWYAKDMAKAVKMGTFALDTKMRPGDKITRQEAFAVLARAFKLTSADSAHKALDKFSDKVDIANWALNDLDGLAAAGYVQGNDGKLNPKANITRAEFAVVMDNLVKQYIDTAGTVTEVVAAGNVMVRVPGVTLQNVTVKGDLIIADGVGEGDATLDNVVVEGRTLIRGGGENSIIIKGNSDLGRVIVSKVDGKVRILVEGNADVEIIYVDDGSDDVIVVGTIGTLEVAGDNVTVTALDATITNGIVSGDNSKIILSGKTTIKNETVTGDGSEIGKEEAGGGGLPSGGDGVPTPSIGIASVTVEGDPCVPVDNLYAIPADADKDNTAITVTITNTAAVNYTAELTIMNGESKVAYAKTTGIKKLHLELLNNEPVSFGTIGLMFDHVGTVDAASYYYDDTANKVEAGENPTQGFFEESIEAMFNRMGAGDTYTVIVKLTPAGGSPGELSFDVTRILSD
ncbi:MAG: hypothetical protein GXX92_00060 [Clostridiales bacterium]|nr:hypothetical protein [Clostridiales bacterium]